MRTYPLNNYTLGADFYLDATVGNLPGYVPRYAAATLTGVPGYGSLTLPVALVITTAGLGLYGLDGYIYGAVTALPALGTRVTEIEGNAAAYYYAALGVVTALPGRLTYAALRAALGGGIFEDLPAPTYANGSAYVVAPGYVAIPGGSGGSGLTFYAAGNLLSPLGYPPLYGIVPDGYVVRAAAVVTLNALGA